jgi:hypothetical protein
MIIRPYIKFDGIPTFRDSEITDLYRTMLEEGTADTVFCDGSVRCADDFLRQMKDDGNILLVALSKDIPIGIGWLNCFEKRTARAHFCMFSEGREIGFENIGRTLIEKAFSVNDLDMLIGMIPATNEAAIKFSQKCGAVLVGYFPSGSYDIWENKYIGTAILYYQRN